MREIFTRSLANSASEASPEEPDLYVVYLGGNDLTGSQVGTNTEAFEATTGGSVAEFLSAYQELLGIIRAKHPHVPVLCVAPDKYTMSAEPTRAEQAETASLVQSLVHKAVDAFSDPGVHFQILRPDPQISDPAEDPEDWAVLAHWSVKGHTKVAGALVEAIKKVMPEWEVTGAPTPCPILEPKCTSAAPASCVLL